MVQFCCSQVIITYLVKQQVKCLNKKNFIAWSRYSFWKLPLQEMDQIELNKFKFGFLHPNWNCLMPWPHKPYPGDLTKSFWKGKKIYPSSHQNWSELEGKRIVAQHKKFIMIQTLCRTLRIVRAQVDWVNTSSLFWKLVIRRLLKQPYNGKVRRGDKSLLFLKNLVFWTGFCLKYLRKMS